MCTKKREKTTFVYRDEKGDVVYSVSRPRDKVRMYVSNILDEVEHYCYDVSGDALESFIAYGENPELLTDFVDEKHYCTYVDMKKASLAISLRARRLSSQNT